MSEPITEDTLKAMAHIICNGPDGQDWLDALADAPDRLDYLDHEGWALVPKQEVRLLLATLDAEEIIEWGGGSSFDRIAERVGWKPIEPSHHDGPTDEASTRASGEQMTKPKYGEPDPECPYCDETGRATSVVTGASGACRHPLRDPGGPLDDGRWAQP